MALAYPDEAWPSETSIEGLDGTTDATTGLPFVAKGVGPASTPTYEVQYNRRLARQNAILAPWRQLQVVDEGGLKLGVYPGVYTLGGERKPFEGATAQAVPDDSTRYVYIDEENALQVATSEPSDLTSFLPLAEVTTAAGVMAIADRRALTALRVPQIEDAGDIAGTPNASFQIDDDDSGPRLKHVSGALQVRSAADDDDANLKCGELDAVDGVRVNGTAALDASGKALAVADGVVSAAALAESVQDLLAACTMSVGQESADSIDVTLQLKDAAGNDLAARRFVRLWLGDSPYAGVTGTAPSAGTSVQQGVIVDDYTTDRHLLALSDTGGVVLLRATHVGARTWYVMAGIGGRVFASSAVSFS